MPIIEPAQDIAKGLRELIACLRDVCDGVADIGKAYDRHKGKSYAKDLSSLCFKQQGSKRVLEKIAAGESTPEDFDVLADMLDASGEEIETSLGRLSKKQTFVRETLGLAWANIGAASNEKKPVCF